MSFVLDLQATPSPQQTGTVQQMGPSTVSPIACISGLTLIGC